MEDGTSQWEPSMGQIADRIGDGALSFAGGVESSAARGDRRVAQLCCPFA